MAGSTEAVLSRLQLNGTEICSFTRIESHSVYELVDVTDETICGTLERDQSMVTPGVQRHRHHILMHPTPEELNVILPLMGFPETPTDTFTVNDTVPAFTMEIDRVVTIHKYENSKIDKAILRGAKGSKPWMLELQIMSLTEADVGATWGGTPAAAMSAPYNLTEGSILTLEGSAMAFDRYVLVLDREMAIRFNDNEIADALSPTNNNFALGVSTPYTTDEEDLYLEATAATRADGAGGSLVFSRGNLSTTITFANLKWMANPPSILKKSEEIRLGPFYRIYKDGSTPSVVFTHDITP